MKEGDANLPVTQSHPHWSESVMRGQKNVVKIDLYSEHQDTDHCTFLRWCFSLSADLLSSHRNTQMWPHVQYSCLTATKESPSAPNCHEPNQYPTYTTQCAQQHIHTNPMQYSPSGEANSSSASQEIPLILQTRGLIPC